jgi:phenylpropionate dioxygenase-like ring-hydroxylating dioxygenase large terminal subunit
MEDTGETAIGALLAALRATRENGHEQAVALPPAFYTDPEMFALECERLFRGQWHCIARVDELRQTGDYVALDLAGEPIVAIRGGDGVLRVLSNVCRHRGTVLLEGKGQARTIVCPYHAWSYGTDGALKRAPLMQGAELFDPASCRLPELRSEVWNGFLYANLDDHAAPLAPDLTGLDALSGNFSMDAMTTVHIEEARWAINWKSLVENFMEGYHLTPTHATTLHPITPTSGCEHFPAGPGYFGYHSRYAPDYPDRGPWAPNLTPEQRRETLMFCVAPAHVVALAPNTMTWMALRPDGPGGVAIRWGIALYDANADAAAVARAVELARGYNGEDKVRLERLQRGLASRHAPRSVLAPRDLEGTVWDFYRYLAGVLAA